MWTSSSIPTSLLPVNPGVNFITYSFPSGSTEVNSISTRSRSPYMWELPSSAAYETTTKTTEEGEAKLSDDNESFSPTDSCCSSYASLRHPHKTPQEFQTNETVPFLSSIYTQQLYPTLMSHFPLINWFPRSIHADSLPVLIPSIFPCSHHRMVCVRKDLKLAFPPHFCFQKAISWFFKSLLLF